jgi:hypothetical protein
MAERAEAMDAVGDLVGDEAGGVGFFGAILRLLFLLALAYAAWLYLSDERRRRELAGQGADALAPLRDHVTRALDEGKRAAAERRAELERAAGKAVASGEASGSTRRLAKDEQGKGQRKAQSKSKGGSGSAI